VSRLRGIAALVAWSTTVVLGLLLLERLGQTTFRTPPAGSAGDLLRWARTTSPLLAAGSCVRLAATAMGWYLLATTVGGVLGRLLGLHRTVRALDRLSLPLVRRLAGRAVGAGLVAQLGLLGGTAGAAAAPPPPPDVATAPASADHEVATMAVIEGHTTTMHLLPGPTDEPATTTTMHALPGPTDEPATTTTMHALPDPTETPHAPGPVATMRTVPDGLEPPPSHAMPTWTVHPGDHLWRIAEVVVALDLGRTPTDERVESYLQRLVDANHDRLVQPDDPDLILPGQQLLLPPAGP
jgi:hypothetical protein